MKRNTSTRRQRVLLFLVVSAALLVGLGAAGMCPASMPVTVVNSVSMGSFTGRMMMISFTSPSSQKPANALEVCTSGYIALYTSGGFCFSVVESKPEATATSKGCKYKGSGTNSRQFNFDVECDTSASGLNVPSKLEMSGSVVFGTLKSSAVCDGSAAGGCTWGCVFLILLLLGVVGYCAGTVVFYYVKQGKRGKELIPHVEFWVSFPGLVKTGAQFSMSKVRSKGNADAYRETL